MIGQWIRLRARALLSLGTVERELDDELRFHIEMETQKLVAAGLSPDEAGRRALLLFGGMERFKEECRDARGGVRLFDDLRQDTRVAVRALLKTPGFTAAVVLTLALGIGANTAIFSVVNAVLLRPLPYAAPARLVALWENDRYSGTTREPSSVPDFFDFRARSHSLARIAGFAASQVAYAPAGAQPERLRMVATTENFFATLGVRPLLGRTFRPAEDAPAGARVALLGEGFWRTHMNRSSAVLGAPLRLDDVNYTIIGVVPDGINLLQEPADVWVPLQYTATSMPRSLHNIGVVARLRDGVTMRQADTEIRKLAAQLEAENTRENYGRGATLESVNEVLLGGVRTQLLVLLGAVGLVLLIACANLANLLLARTAVRRREFAVRAALGATTTRLARQFFAESAVLTGAAVLVGLVLARFTLRALVALAPAGLPRVESVSMDATVLLVTAVIAAVVAAAFGLLPIHVARRNNLQDTLKSESSRAGTPARGQAQFRALLVVSELALSVILLVSAGLLIRSFTTLRDVDPGFRPDHVLKLSFQLPASRYPQSYRVFPRWPEVQRVYSELLPRVQSLPGVEAAALAANNPLQEGFTNSFVIIGREAESEKGQAEVHIRMASPEYFRTVGIPLLRGRALSQSDDAQATAVLLINEAMARKFFAKQDPIGQHIRFWGSPREVVGIVANEKFKGLAEDAPPAVYPPLAQTPIGNLTLLVRTSGAPMDLIGAIRRELSAVDRELPLYDIETLDQTLSQSIAHQRFTMLLLAVFAGLALLLAAVGVHGVLSYIVAQRTHEVGIRMALGASRSEVVRMIVGQGMRMASYGILIGCVGALMSARLLAGLLFGVASNDARTFGAVVALIATIALVASYLPARRATAVDPMSALRMD